MQIGDWRSPRTAPEKRYGPHLDGCQHAPPLPAEHVTVAATAQQAHELEILQAISLHDEHSLDAVTPVFSICLVHIHMFCISGDLSMFLKKAGHIRNYTRI